MGHLNGPSSRARDAAAVEKETLQDLLPWSGEGFCEICLESLRPFWGPAPHQVRSPETTTQWAREAWVVRRVWTGGRSWHGGGPPLWSFPHRGLHSGPEALLMSSASCRIRPSQGGASPRPPGAAWRQHQCRSSVDGARGTGHRTGTGRPPGRKPVRSVLSSKSHAGGAACPAGSSGGAETPQGRGPCAGMSSSPAPVEGRLLSRARSPAQQPHGQYTGERGPTRLQVSPREAPAGDPA